MLRKNEFLVNFDLIEVFDFPFFKISVIVGTRIFKTDVKVWIKIAWKSVKNISVKQ